MPSMKSLATCQKVHLPVALAFLNNGHNSNLRAYYVGVRFEIVYIGHHNAKKNSPHKIHSNKLDTNDKMKIYKDRQF